MCLYSRLMPNPKYRENKKNRGIIPAVFDDRVKWVPWACGNCMECSKKRAREWKVRIQEDIKTYTNGKFLTLTYSNESYRDLAIEMREKANKKIEELQHVSVYTKEIRKEVQKNKLKTNGYGLDNEIATRSMRLFLERWRKKYGVSLRHWIVTELGQKNTEHLHIHAILWADDVDEVEKIWKYGTVWKGKEEPNGKLKNYVNEATAGYITKYITKKDIKHKEYKPIVLCSPGIGRGYTDTIVNKISCIDRTVKRTNKGWFLVWYIKTWREYTQKTYNATKNKYKEGETRETYITRTGHNVMLPVYWRNKIYSEEEREALWIEKLNKEVRWINGVKISIKNGEEEYYRALKIQQEINNELGYGTGEKNWERETYERERRNLKQNERIKNNKNKKE